MTKIMYECKGTDGEFLTTTSLSEAKQFAEDHEGSYKLINVEEKSTSEGYAKKGHKRRPNSRT